MLISIITINYNNSLGFEKTVQSVISQTSKDFEYIIVDGGSTDGSLKIISDNQLIIDKWVSEKDNGIFAAMNKGTKMATGDYLLFLNSGDCLVDKDVIKDVINHGIHADVLEGHTRCERNGNFSHIWAAPEHVTANTFYEGSLCHQSAFIRRLELLSRSYDEACRICSDWRFFFETLIMNAGSYEYIDRLISTFDVDGLSNSTDIKWIEIKNLERRSVLETIFPAKYLEDYDNYIGNRSYLENKIFNLRKKGSSFVKIVSKILYYGDRIVNKLRKG